MPTIPIFIGDSEEKESGGLVIKDSTADKLFELQQSYPHQMTYELIKDGKDGISGELIYRLVISFPEKTEELKNKKLEALQSSLDESESGNKDSNFIDSLSLED